MLSLMPFTLEDGPEIDLPEIDKLVHFTFYFVAVFLGGIWVQNGDPKGAKFTKQILFLGLGLFFYGIIIEVLQGVLPTERSAEVLDGVANTLGLLSGILILKYARKNASI
ncbi:MAG: hypothetical protein RLZZ241_703 [Bacteroidota bacterium]